MGVSVSAMYGRQFPSVYAGVYAMDCRCTIPNQTTGIGHSANGQATVVSWATCISIDCECFFYRFTLDNIMAMVAPGGYMEQRMGGGVIHYSNEWRPGEYGVYMQFPYTVMKNMDPLCVTLWCATAMIAICFLLGVITTACNLWLRKGCGATFMATIAAISVIPNLRAINPGPIKLVLWISPRTGWITA